ncbi:MAG TPA: type II toxin-antitoxin system PrlF family antitoxin [Nitrospira sp.]|nr:type II toxin-antitoxin system PrlF family antitoxin [Nitrospira sp.]
MIATLTSKGQMTIPKPIRDHLGLHADQLDFVIEPDGRVTLRSATIDVMDLAGLLRQKGKKALSLKEMQRGVLKGATRHTR